MSSCKYLSILFIFFIPNYVVSEEDVLHAEIAARKYIAAEDTDLFLEQQKTLELENEAKSIDSNDLDEARTGDPKIITHTYTLEDVEDIVKLYFYTKENPEGVEFDPKKLPNPSFDSSKPTKIISHGWRASSQTSTIMNLKDAYLDEQDVNIIGVDWSPIAGDIIYPNAAVATNTVGKYVANVVNDLVEKQGARYEDFHLIGHSLGAHVAGSAGNNTRKKVGRITGLDPALPGFQLIKLTEERLDASDANFVDVIHTCSGILGMSIPVGDVDFYPNGGSPFQPGCCLGGFPIETQTCSHSRSHEYFAESIRHSDFKAVNCQDWNHFKNNECESVYTKMGEYTDKNTKGIFYLRTNGITPYALGFLGTQYAALFDVIDNAIDNANQNNNKS